MDPKTFLAENVLNEEKTVTYRLLSRTLKVHPNTAKQMLYDFHRTQNAKRVGSVHAMYLVYGIKSSVDHRPAATPSADGDVDMENSTPETGDLSDPVPTSTLSLIPEERLPDAISEYEQVSSIHVYSLGSHPNKDVALLADAANEALNIKGAETGSGLAPIRNPHVRRRQRQGAGLKAAAAATTAVKPQPKPFASKTEPAAKIKEEANASVKPSQESEKSVPSSASTVKKGAPALKRGTSASSGIMQAFSKAATKVKKENSSRPATPSGEDSSMQPMSDDGEDDSEMPLPKARAALGAKSRQQRQEELRRMMDEDEDDDAAESRPDSPEPQEEEMEEAVEEPEPIPPKEEPKETVTSSGDGRRRGRRQVMRKKQINDEDGYLVTIQEPGWESFSEDEAPAPTKPKTAPAPAPAAKTKKGGPKGQGSIMSFFSKK